MDDVIFSNDAGLTVGFERTLYSFGEPDAGTSLIRGDICVTVSNGELGFPLVVVPQWTATTATGKLTLQLGETDEAELL